MPALQFYTSNVTVSDTAVALTVSQLATQVMAQIDGNLSAGITVRIGNASGQYLMFSSLGVIVLPVSNVNQVYAIASGGSATINWIAHTQEAR